MKLKDEIVHQDTLEESLCLPRGHRVPCERFGVLHHRLSYVTNGVQIFEEHALLRI